MADEVSTADGEGQLNAAAAASTVVVVEDAEEKSAGDERVRESETQLASAEECLDDEGDAVAADEGFDVETARRSDSSEIVDDAVTDELDPSNEALENCEVEDTSAKNPESDYESLDDHYGSDNEPLRDASCSDPCCSEEGGQEDMAHLGDGEDIDDPEWGEEEEREDGDGEESEVLQSKEKALDFDEDRRNPQYIPKKGGFYEHDDRLGEEEAEEEEKKKGGKKKKLWQDEGLWKHDRFQVDEQNPKSKEELVTIYGYDIRNEDGPPRARRRRRYGRGPSKYTRNWEDEDAYAKQGPRKGGEDGSSVMQARGGFRGRRGRGGGPAFRGRRGDHVGSQEYMGRGSAVPRNEEGPTEEDEENFVEGSKGRTAAVVSDATEEIRYAKASESVSRNETSAIGDAVVPRDCAADESFNVDSAPPLPSRGREQFGRGLRKNYSRAMHHRGGGSSRPGDYDAVHDLSKGIERLNFGSPRAGRGTGAPPLHEGRKEAKVAPTQHSGTSQPHERRQAAVPPRLQDSTASRPKRYSSQRQRQGPEQLLQPPYQQQQQSSCRGQSNNSSLPPRFYDSGYQHPIYAEPSSQGNSQQGPTAIISQHYQGYDASYQEAAYAIRPMASPPRMFNPVSLATGHQPVIPAPYIAPSGNIISYGPPPAAYTPQYQFQQYPAPAPPVADHLDSSLTALPQQPQEIFRCGMAYYNAPPPVRTLPKRPRAAIPIVPPPELEEQRKDDGKECSEGVDSRSCYSPEQVTNINN